MVKLAAERGYDHVTLRDLTGVAKVSSRALYEHFGGKEDCFLRTHELVVRSAARRIAAAQANEQDWQERLSLAFRAFALELEREPSAARFALIEAYAAGSAAREQAKRVERTVESILSDSFRRAPDGVVLPPFVMEGIVAGIVGFVRGKILSTKTSLPPALADDLLEWVLRCRVHIAEFILPSLASKNFRAPANGSLSSSSGEDKTELRSCMADRDLIFAAVAKIVCSEAASPITVDRICSAAGLSRRKFNTHFKGLNDCLLAVADQRVSEVVARALEDREAAVTWEEGIYAAMTTICKEVAADPALARLCFTEGLLTGVKGLSALALVSNGLARLISPSNLSHGIALTVSIEATASMICGIISFRVRAGYAGRVPCLASELAVLAFIPEGENALGPSFSQSKRSVVRLARPEAREVSGGKPCSLIELDEGRKARGKSGELGQRVGKQGSSKLALGLSEGDAKAWSA
jgi:AcrR family transcriptional regulator